MLKTILSISGKPGLYKLISQGKNMLIVESLVDKKRFPAYGNEKIISLGDIAMYTDTEEVGKRCSRGIGCKKGFCERAPSLFGGGVA
jgi:hypothetical protein